MVLGWLKGFFSRGRKGRGYVEILIESDVIENIIAIARETHPREFIALLKGKIREKKLVIDSLIYQNYTASTDAAIIQLDLPIMSGAVGSVHSHPGPSNRPSAQDLVFFSKQGGVNLIIAMPYNIRTIAAYDGNGNPIPVKVL